MIDDDYAKFCDQAHDMRKQTEAFFASFSDYEIAELNGLVRHEIVSTPFGKAEPTYDCLAALLVEEVEHRNDPLKNVTRLPRRFPDGVPF